MRIPREQIIPVLFIALVAAAFMFVFRGSGFILLPFLIAVPFLFGGKKRSWKGESEEDPADWWKKERPRD